MNAAQLPPPMDPWPPGVRAADVPIAEGGDPNPLENEATGARLCPNKADIAAHLYALFPPAFVQAYPDGWIEIAYANPAAGGLDAAENFSAFNLQAAAEFAEKKNKAGFNIYVGAALRYGEPGARGRASGAKVLTASHAWAEFDKSGDDTRIDAVLKEKNLPPTMTVVTGRTPHLRAHLYFALDGRITPDQLRTVNTALKTLLSSDAVQNPDRVMRLAGTISYPTPKKVERGYIPERVTLHIRKDAPAYTIEQLTCLVDKQSGPEGSETKPGRNDHELMALLEASRRTGEWHNSIRNAIATMIGRGWSNSVIRLMCKNYCSNGYSDHDLDALIDDARKKWGAPDEEPVDPAAVGADDVARLNKAHAVLPIGGKTRIVTFGELDEFPGRETIVMTQSVGDFVSLTNKYRHFYLDKKGELKSEPMGSHWIGSQRRRQYDGGMAFMPQHDGDVGNRLNLWRGFGVKPVKGDCSKFLDFMRDIICSGNETNFDYLRKREATILQKRIRTEVALGLQTKEEGCGKGFYEKTMRRLTGHAMQLANPKHIVGAFNPHLEPLLRLTADEALFVGNPEHRNALFNLITEPEMTIEPKNCGIYSAASYLNMTILSNSDHFLPVSDTARRFFIPTMSAARKQDFVYFTALQKELDNGGYEALLHHLLHEVDLTDFNVRAVPQTEGLRQQRDHGLQPLDAWWCELLETGTLWGADPKDPRKAVSNTYDRFVKIKVAAPFGGTNIQVRQFKQSGLYDQARRIEPRLGKYTSDHGLGTFLTKMGCDNAKKVMRRQGWTFPPLEKARAEWIERYPGWKWRNPDITEWRADESDDVEDIDEADLSA
ncbi:hypothetical protein AB7M42_008796 [Bradyrhizobium diazoefficiens]